MRDVNGLLRRLFKISFFVYPVTLVVAILWGTIFGIDSGWAMPAMSSHEIMYGWDAIVSYLIIIVFRFAFVYIIILVFQISYIIIRLCTGIRSRIRSS